MKQGKLNSNNYSPESFDIVTSFEVIEHIYNPKEELCQISELMRKGGLVYLTTPNFNSITRYWLKQTYDNICYPEHLSYYTPKTIKNLFMNRGFITKRIETTGVSITRLINKEALLNQTIISATSEDEILRKNIEQKQYLRFLKKIMNYILTFLGIGDSLKGSFEKV
jgi:2-polyprenyl-3-methyl-5-hydroxy-6-metoxy-1,4-benzoquinol methylase